VFRLLVFVPYVIAEVTVGIMWSLILLGGSVGDQFLNAIGLGEKNPRSPNPYDPANRRVEMRIKTQ